MNPCHIACLKRVVNAAILTAMLSGLTALSSLPSGQVERMAESEEQPSVLFTTFF